MLTGSGPRKIIHGPCKPFTTLHRQRRGNQRSQQIKSNLKKSSKRQEKRQEKSPRRQERRVSAEVMELNLPVPASPAVGMNWTLCKAEAPPTCWPEGALLTNTVKGKKKDGKHTADRKTGRLGRLHSHQPGRLFLIVTPGAIHQEGPQSSTFSFY